MSTLEILSIPKLQQHLERLEDKLAKRGRFREDKEEKAAFKEESASRLEVVVSMLRKEDDLERSSIPCLREDVTLVKEALQCVRLLIHSARGSGDTQRVYELRGEQKTLRKTHRTLESLWSPKFSSARPHKPVSNRRKKRITWHNQHATSEEHTYIFP